MHMRFGSGLRGLLAAGQERGWQIRVVRHDPEDRDEAGRFASTLGTEDGCVATGAPEAIGVLAGLTGQPSVRGPCASMVIAISVGGCPLQSATMPWTLKVPDPDAWAYAPVPPVIT